MFDKNNKNTGLENIILHIQDELRDHGYTSKRYSDSKKYETSAYDCIIIKSNDGHYYELMVSELTEHRQPCTNDIFRPEDKFNSIRKYENYSDDKLRKLLNEIEDDMKDFHLSAYKYSKLSKMKDDVIDEMRLRLKPKE